MLTIFTTCAPFEGERDQIQRNAIVNWMHLESAPEILLMGHEEGVQKFADEYALRVIDVEYNELNAPLLNSIFSIAKQHAHNDILCFSDSDLSFFGLIKAIKILKNSEFKDWVAVGQRYENDVLDTPSACSFCIFPKKMDWSHMPPFAIGGTNSDTWVTANTLKRGIPLVNITEDVRVVHFPHSKKYKKSPRNEELSRRNIILAKNNSVGSDVATYYLIQGRIIPCILYFKYKKFGGEKNVDDFYNMRLIQRNAC